MEAAQTPPSPPPTQPTQPSGLADYPLQADAPLQDELNRFLPLIKWLLILPHALVLLFVFIGVAVVHLIAFFAVLITGRYPRGMFDFVVGAYRWVWRVNAYAGLFNDTYPPFSLQPDPSYPASYEIEYPERTERWRPLVSWLLIIPYLFVATLLAYVAAIVTFIAIFVILFTARLPEGMYRLMLIPRRWQARATAYAMFLTTRYPPFEWG